MNKISYEADFYGWANEQAALLRDGLLHEADIANIAEEIESLARTEKREYIRLLSKLLKDLLIWNLLPGGRCGSAAVGVKLGRLNSSVSWRKARAWRSSRPSRSAAPLKKLGSSPAPRQDLVRTLFRRRRPGASSRS